MLFTFHIVSLGLFTIGAIGFTVKAHRTKDDLMRWLGAGSALAAWARVNYVVFPSLYTRNVYTGDFLRLGFYIVIAVAAAGEIRRYWRGLALAAVVDERRRMARDLHDGLAQELAYIVGQAGSLRRRGDPELDNVAAAAERALDESRRAIHALTTTVDEPLDISLARAAEDVAQRVGTLVRCDMDPGIELSLEAREALIRIVREAVTNAARHGAADHVDVALRNHEKVELAISDDGTGFRPEAASRGFGLASMTERAAAIGGTLSIDSEIGKGTTITVLLP